MSRLWRGRQNADYDDNFRVDSSEANKHLKMAILTANELAKLKKKTARH
jgi:hypothetical protein